MDIIETKSCGKEILAHTFTVTKDVANETETVGNEGVVKTGKQRLEEVLRKPVV